MKKGRKIFTIILTALSLFCVSTVFVFASEGAPVKENVFEAAYGFFGANAEKIFSALAFGGTLLLGFFYKRGLTPYIGKSLGALSDGVAKIRKECEKSGELYGVNTDKITERLGTLENSLELFSREIGSLEDKLGTQAEYLSDRETYRKILALQIDMLSEVFLFSSLPQYQKDKVGEQVKKMKEALAENENT